MWDGFEGRRFPRVKSKCQLFIQSVEGKSPISALTENIGLGGVCVILKEPLGKLSRIRLSLELEDAVAPIDCEARIVWCVESREWGSDTRSYDTGIEFLNLSDQDRKRVECLIRGKVGTK